RLEQGYALWEPHPFSRDDNRRVWRVSRMMGYSDLRPEEAEELRPAPIRPVPEPDLLVIDDAGVLFRHRTDSVVHSLAQHVSRRTGFILLKMPEPVAQGELWHALYREFADRLVCLVAARDLRRETLGLSHGLSWEATLDDLRVALHSHPAV